MEKLEIVEKEIFSLLTSKQIGEISEAAVIKDFEAKQIIYDRKEAANNLFILLEGEILKFDESILKNCSVVFL